MKVVVMSMKDPAQLVAYDLHQDIMLKYIAVPQQQALRIQVCYPKQATYETADDWLTPNPIRRNLSKPNV